MIMVEIGDNAILFEPTKSRKDSKKKRTNEFLFLRLKQAGVQPKKHVLNNEMLEPILTFKCSSGIVFCLRSK